MCNFSNVPTFCCVLDTSIVVLKLAPKCQHHIILQFVVTNNKLSLTPTLKLGCAQQNVDVSVQTFVLQIIGHVKTISHKKFEQIKKNGQ